MTRPQRPLAVITGASRGIGLAIAEALAPEHELLLVGRSERSLAPTAERLGGSTFVADLESAEDRARLCERIKGASVLVNNAGVAPSAPAHHTDDATWAQTMTVNATAPFELCRAVIGGMKKAGWGRIVNIASTAALKGYKFTAAYSASKGALLSMTRAMAVELAPTGITVNAIAPGFIETRLTAAIPVVIREAARRLSNLSQGGQPRDVGDAITFLSTPGSQGLTGQVLRVCGGALVGA